MATKPPESPMCGTENCTDSFWPQGEAFGSISKICVLVSWPHPQWFWFPCFRIGPWHQYRFFKSSTSKSDMQNSSTVVLQLEWVSGSCRGLVETYMLPLTPTPMHTREHLIQCIWEACPRICISNKLPGDAHAVLECMVSHLNDVTLVTSLFPVAVKRRKWKTKYNRDRLRVNLRWVFPLNTTWL